MPTLGRGDSGRRAMAAGGEVPAGAPPSDSRSSRSRRCVRPRRPRRSRGLWRAKTPDDRLRHRARASRPLSRAAAAAATTTRPAVSCFVSCTSASSRASSSRAREVAEQMLSLGVMPDVARHDAARAMVGRRRFRRRDRAPSRGRADRPAERRAIHLSALGGVLYAIGRGEEAIARSNARSREDGAPAPLLRGQLALARGRRDRAGPRLSRAGRPSVRRGVRPVRPGRARLPARRSAAREAPSRGFSRADQAFAPAARAALSPEIARATATLGRIVWN